MAHHIKHILPRPGSPPWVGYVLGVGTKIFYIAGPVIVYGMVWIDLLDIANAEKKRLDRFGQAVLAVCMMGFRRID